MIEDFLKRYQDLAMAMGEKEDMTRKEFGLILHIYNKNKVPLSEEALVHFATYHRKNVKERVKCIDEKIWQKECLTDMTGRLLDYIEREKLAIEYIKRAEADGIPAEDYRSQAMNMSRMRFETLVNGGPNRHDIKDINKLMEIAAHRQGSGTSPTYEQIIAEAPPATKHGIPFSSKKDRGAITLGEETEDPLELK